MTGAPAPASRWPAVIGAGLTLLGMALIVLITARTRTDFLDDALITMTYAKNLLLGNGFVYNAPPPTFGTTSPLWTMLLAAFAWPLGAARLPETALWLSAACWIGTLWLLYAARARWKLGDIGAGLLCLLTGSAYHANLGMEQCLFQFLLIALLLLTLRAQFALAGIVGGLLFLARGEGALAVFLAGLYALYLGDTLRARRANGLCLSAGFWGVAAPWLLFAWWRFGAALPATMKSKMAQGLLPGYEWFHEALYRALAHEWPHEADGIVTLAHVVWPLLFLGAGYIIWRKSALLGLFVWTLLYAAAYAALHLADFFWYETPVYWTWLYCLAAGMAALLHAAGRVRWRWPRRIAQCYVAGLIAAVVVARALAAVGRATTMPDVHADIYKPAAAWISAHAPANCTIGAAEVGYLGFYTQMPIIDQFGLVTPEALALLGEPSGAAFLRQFQPDFYVVATWNGAEAPPLGTFRQLGYRDVARFKGSRRESYVFANAKSPRLNVDHLLQTAPISQ